VTVILAPDVIMIEITRTTAHPRVTESDVIRWIGVAVAVAGVILATPDGIASAWLSVKREHRKAIAFGRRLLRLPAHSVARAGTAHGRMTLGGRAHGHRWRQWLPHAGPLLKIDILHQQVDILLEEINKLRTQIDQTGDNLRKEIREAEGRVIAQVRQLAAEMQGERTQASHVDARGFGPIALGIIMTGLSNELAAVPPGGWLGWLAIAVAVFWTIRASPGWLRDYKQALDDSKG
jgi:hypothetical protein